MDDLKKKNVLDGSAERSRINVFKVRLEEIEDKNFESMYLNEIKRPDSYISPCYSLSNFSINAIQRKCWKPLRVALMKKFPSVDITIDEPKMQYKAKFFCTKEEKDFYAANQVLEEFYYDTVSLL